MFKVGDKVFARQVVEDYGIEDAVEGEVVGIDQGLYNKLYTVLYKYPDGSQRTGNYTECFLMYANLRSCSSENLCPRCKGKLIEKESEGFFGDKYKVNKCEGCGWC